VPRYRCAIANEAPLTFEGAALTFFAQQGTGKRRRCCACGKTFYSNTKARKCMECKPNPVRHCKNEKCNAVLIEPRARLCAKCKE
jgi:hypothetical protein